MTVMGVAYITWSLSWLVVSLCTLTVGVGCLFVGKNPPSVPAVPGVPAKRSKRRVSRRSRANGSRSRRTAQKAQINKARRQQEWINGLGFTTIKCSSAACMHAKSKECSGCACNGQNHGKARAAGATKPPTKRQPRRTPRTTPVKRTPGIRKPRAKPARRKAA